MTIYLSDLSKNEKHKTVLENSGMTEQVGWIELGNCPNCFEPNLKPIRNKKRLEVFNSTGICVHCQKLMEDQGEVFSTNFTITKK